MDALIREGAVRVEEECHGVVSVGVDVGHVPYQLSPISVVLRDLLGGIVVVLQRPPARVRLNTHVVACSHLTPRVGDQLHRDEVERSDPDLAEVVPVDP